MSWPLYSHDSAQPIWPGWHDCRTGLYRRPDGVMVCQPPPAVPAAGYVMRIVVCGGRTYPHNGRVHRALNAVHWRKPITRLIHAATPGTASLAAAWAVSNGVDAESHLLLAGLPPRAAEQQCNAEMIATAPEGVIAFPGGRSTADLCMRADSSSIRIWRPFG